MFIQTIAGVVGRIATVKVIATLRVFDIDLPNYICSIAVDAEQAVKERLQTPWDIKADIEMIAPREIIEQYAAHFAITSTVNDPWFKDRVWNFHYMDRKLTLRECIFVAQFDPQGRPPQN